MERDVQAARKLFGEMAVHKGYCTDEDVQRALEIQRALEKSGPRKMLGLIMLEETMIDNAQFLELLVELDHFVHDEDAADFENIDDEIIDEDFDEDDLDLELE